MCPLINVVAEGLRCISFSKLLFKKTEHIHSNFGKAHRFVLPVVSPYEAYEFQPPLAYAIMLLGENLWCARFYPNGPLQFYFVQEFIQ